MGEGTEDQRKRPPVRNTYKRRRDDLSDFSIASNLAANNANFELDLQQSTLERAARDLSSGLRINNAADDPSGLAIATDLQTRVDAFNQAATNIHLAAQAATIADGALSTTTEILLRIRSLAVEAASAIESSSDRSNLQAEIGQLLLEVNRISQNTTFNGVGLLDGSHSGFVPAQSATLNVTANSVLATAGPAGTPTSASAFLLACAVVNNLPPYPTFTVTLEQNALASSSPQTVKVTSAPSIVPGMVFTDGSAIVHVLSTDPAAGTMTATFSQALASNSVINAFINDTTATAVSAGVQIMTLSGTAQPLYAGEVLQIDATNFTNNDVVVVQKVLGPNTFVADFSKAHPAGVPVFNINYEGVAPIGAGNITFNFGAIPADAPLDGTPAYIEESASSFGAASGQTAIVNEGTVIASTPTTETVAFTTATQNLFGGNFTLMSALGNGNVPLSNPLDGTIKLQVVNTGVSIAVQETYYDTASQISTTSPFLIAPNESTMLFDGVITTTGNFTTADVGLTSYIKVHQATAAISAANNPALNVLSGSQEGQTVAMGIPAVNTQTLRISTATVIGANGSDPTLAAQDTIGQIDFALQNLLNDRAEIGAAIVRLHEDGTNDARAAMEFQASESSIRDVNVGAASTAFTRAQVETQVGTSVLAKADALTEVMLELFR